MDRKLKQKLDQYTVPGHSEKALEETIYRARELTAWISRTGDERMTMGQFFFDQCRFVRPHTWLLKAGLALLMAVWLPGSITGSEIWFWTVVSLAGPLLCLINANDLGGFFQPGIIEIQMTAKYSLRHAFLARLTLFGVIDAIVIGAVSAVMTACGTAAAWQVLLYSTVPYLLMCTGCMVIFQKVREESTLFAARHGQYCLPVDFWLRSPWDGRSMTQRQRPPGFSQGPRLWRWQSGRQQN